MVRSSAVAARRAVVSLGGDDRDAEIDRTTSPASGPVEADQFACRCLQACVQSGDFAEPAVVAKFSGSRPPEADSATESHQFSGYVDEAW